LASVWSWPKSNRVEGPAKSLTDGGEGQAFFAAEPLQGAEHAPLGDEFFDLGISSGGWRQFSTGQKSHLAWQPARLFVILVISPPHFRAGYGERPEIAPAPVSLSCELAFATMSRVTYQRFPA